MKPLCPTRWTVRGQAVDTVLSQYETVLSTLEEMASVGSDTGTRANSLLEHFQKGKTVLGLLVASDILGELECLNKSLQKQSQTIVGMQAAAEYVSLALRKKRNEEHFAEVFQKAELRADSLGIEPIQTLHQRKPPARFTGKASQLKPKTPQEYYRIEFFKVLDSLDVQFKERFNQPDLQILSKLENVLLTGQMDDVMSQYPEINIQSFKVQLSMFLSKHHLTSSTEAANILRKMPSEVRGLFDEVEKLVGVLLVVPVSLAEAERSFSALKRLKTWLRSASALIM